MGARAAAMGALLLAPLALALEAPRWPPPPEVLARMAGLQARMRDPGAAAAERDAARDELAALLKSPAGQARRTPGEKRPARAAIDPFPGTVRPAHVAPRAAPPADGVAKLEVVEPPRPPIVDPRSGAVAAPSAGFAVDPRTGAVLHETPYGYVDPRTGRVVPR